MTDSYPITRDALFDGDKCNTECPFIKYEEEYNVANCSAYQEMGYLYKEWVALEEYPPELEIFFRCTECIKNSEKHSENLK